MNGTLIIIDGEPGYGKSLEAVRLMIESARRKRNICTNVAVKPLFIRKAKQLNPAITVLKPTPLETKEFWKYIPEGADIYIDEAHLIWPAAFWKDQRQLEFMAYISQFRKAGDTIYLMAQNYENVDNFIRQRATKLYSCKRLSWPKFFPKQLAGQPIIFFVNTWSTSAGERKNRIAWPRFYTPGMCKWTYQMYDTRGTVDIPLYDKSGQLITPKPRPTWESFTMPTVLTEENAQSEITGEAAKKAATPATPQVVINNTPAPEKKRGGKLKWIALATIILGAAAYGKYKLEKHNTPRTAPTTLTTAENQHYKPKPLITYYGTIDNDVLIGTKEDGYALWPIGRNISGFTLLAADTNGITVRGPGRVFHRTWWVPPKTHNHKHTTPVSPTKIFSK